MVQWNLSYSLTEMDTATFNGVTVDPDPFVSASTTYRIRTTFRNLVGPASAASLVLKARATDVNGRARTSVTS